MSSGFDRVFKQAQVERAIPRIQDTYDGEINMFAEIAGILHAVSGLREYLGTCVRVTQGQAVAWKVSK